MMVAELMAPRRSGSPVNGETPCNMPPAGNSNGGPLHYGSDSGPPSLHGSLSPRGPDSPNSDNYSSGGFGAMVQHSKELFSQRKQREFIPDNKKDNTYWDRRRRNNEAAKRSREKRRYHDMVLEKRVVDLTKENMLLKAQLTAIEEKFGITGLSLVNVDQVLANCPTNDQVLNSTKRVKLSHSGPLPPPHHQQHQHQHHSSMYNPAACTPSPIPTSVIQHQSISHPAASHLSSSSSSNSPPNFYAQTTLHQDNGEYSEAETFAPFPFTPILPPIHPPMIESSTNNVLNLSRSRGRSRPPSPYDPIGSGDEAPVSYVSNNNCLPHKLRHKSHLGDKDVVATALLSLQNIKQEPGSRASPPWDNEGSSDERDSGISIDSEWTSTTSLNNPPTSPPLSHGRPNGGSVETNESPAADDPNLLKSQVARLASEVATLQNILYKKGTIK